MTNYLRALYYLYGLMKRPFWTKEKLREYQNKMLKRIVRHAYGSAPFYHKKLSEAGINPDDIRTVEDLNKLPITSKEEIRKNLSEVLSRDFNVKRLKQLHTSGSTGYPLYFYITQAEDEFRKAKHLRANISLGQKPRDKWVTITSPLHYGETTRLQRMLGVYAPTPVSVFDDINTLIPTIQRLHPDVLDGYSNSLLLIAKEVEKNGIETIRPRLIIGGAELIDVSSCKLIEDVFRVPLYDQYACVEFERMAWQCPERVGYHVDADTVIMQLVDENGEEVAGGERGEVVCTSLFNYAMPFIRYAVGDVGVASEETDCPCGRTFPLMKLLEGRADSLLFFPGGRVLSPFAFIAAMLMFKFYCHIDQFRVIQKKADLFRFLIKLKDGTIDERIVEDELVAHVQRLIKVGEDEIKFEAEFVDDIPLDASGKFMLVVSEVGKASRGIREFGVG